jgi:predicted outer membrane repeat protein
MCERLCQEDYLQGCDPDPDYISLPSGDISYSLLPERWGAGKFGLLILASHGAWNGAVGLVRIYDISRLNKGGYAGSGAANPNSRDIEKLRTTLSGEIGRPGNQDNSYHVVTVGPGVCEASILDGFTIADGYADGNDSKGGGMYNKAGHPTLTNCIFTKNHAVGFGGAIYNGYLCNPTIADCKFSTNSAARGGAVYIDKSGQGNLTFKGCILEANSAGYGGGAVYNDVSSAMLTNCVF